MTTKRIVLLAIMLIVFGCFFTGCSSSNYNEATTTKKNDVNSNYSSNNSYSNSYSSNYSNGTYDKDQGAKYDPNDKYYSENDHNSDGYLNVEEFQDAMGDFANDYYNNYP